MKAAQEADEARAAGDVARELERALDRLRAGLAEEAHRRLAHRRQPRQPFGQGDHPLMPVIAGDVQELAGGLAHGADDLGMSMARGADGDAGGEIKKAVAVDVPDLDAAPMRHHERIVARVGRRDHLGVAGDHGPRLGPGKFGLEVAAMHAASFRCQTTTVRDCSRMYRGR